MNWILVFAIAFASIAGFIVGRATAPAELSIEPVAGVQPSNVNFVQPTAHIVAIPHLGSEVTRERERIKEELESSKDIEQSSFGEVTSDYNDPIELPNISLPETPAEIPESLREKLHGLSNPSSIPVVPNNG